MKTRGKLLITAAVVLLAGGAAYAWYASPGKEDTEAEATNQIMTVEAGTGTVSVRVEGPSIVEPYMVQDVRSRASGVVISGPADGDLVGSGQVVVLFDTSDMETAIRQAQLNLEQNGIDLDKAERALEKARTDYDETKRLADQGAVAQSKVTAATDAVKNAELALASARVRVKQAELSLSIARDNVADAKIAAPFSGVVLESRVRPGDSVSSGSVLFTVADVSRVRLRAEVDEYDIGKIAEGMPVTVSSDALPDETLKSKVEQISPAAEIINNISIFTVSTVIQNSEGLLRPGMSADVSILISSDKGIIVPSKAVSSVRGRSYIDVYENEEVVTKRVTAGADDGVNTAVTEGLEEGAVVVLPQSSAFTISSTESTAGTSIVPITVPGTGGGR